MTAVVIYRHDSDGRWWVRNAVEFDDGRFEPVDAAPPPLPDSAVTTEQFDKLQFGRVLHERPNHKESAMTEDQIKHMVNRFLSWHLPENFNPDGGISFQQYGNVGTEHQYEHAPSGTNLFDATQADAMVRHMLEGLPDSAKKELK